MIRAHGGSSSKRFILLLMLAVVATASFQSSSIRNQRTRRFRLAFTSRSYYSQSRLSKNKNNFRLVQGQKLDCNNKIFSHKILPSSSFSLTSIVSSIHNMSRSSSLFSSPTQKRRKLDQEIMNQNNGDGDDDDNINNQLVYEDDDDVLDDDDDDNVNGELLAATTSTTIDNNNNTTSIDNLPKGIPDGFCIIDHRTIPNSGFTPLQLEEAFPMESITRLKLTTKDVTVPVALLLLFPEQFATYTKARKESRRKKILVARGPLSSGQEGVEVPNFDRENLVVGKVADRVHPGDTIAIQTRMSPNYSECRNHDDAPPFELPVVYEDDHFAIVNKPEGIVVFSHKNGGYGRNSVKACLPWVLTPPKAGLISVLRRPCPVHRIDRGTSGLLVCAKTKPAMAELARLFRERKVKKTYTAIVNGDIQEPNETSITQNDAKKLGVCVDNGGLTADSKPWQIIDDDIEGQSAVTIWRALQRMPLENARNNTVSVVELKPMTGRFHQLRRHMAWVSGCPLLGDKSYDGGGLAIQLRDNGFYLCSNRVSLEHPFYNAPPGKSEWAAVRDTMLGEKEGGNIKITEEEDGTVWIHCKVDLPAKFHDFYAITKTC